MMIHHIVANSLYFSYIFGNAVPFGSMIAYLHDLADIPANLGKVFSSTVYETISSAIGVWLMIVWGYTRIIILPWFIYHMFKGLFTYPAGFEQLQPFMLLGTILLSLMCCLHIYWFTLFLRMFYHFIGDGKIEDLGNRVEKSKRE